MPIVTFTTDFGTADGYAAAMKGVVLSLSPSATLVDLTHEVPSGDVAAGAFALAQAAPHFPAGTVHLGVVDPGVGSARAGVVIEAGGSFFVGPDNGLFTAAARGPHGARRIENRAWLRDTVSATFHGRDVFAPVAGRLARGDEFAAVGPSVDQLTTLSEAGGARLQEEGSVWHVDRFGNLITSFAAGQLSPGTWRIELASGAHFTARAGRTFSDVPAFSVVLYDGSAGRVEIAMRSDSAAERLGLERGDRLRLAREGS